MASYSADTLVENFTFIGLSPEDAVIAKCLELCISYKTSEESLVDAWVAFSISNLKNAPPSLDGLDLFERKELSKNKGSANSVVQTPERKKPVGKTRASVSSPAPAPKTPSQSQANQSLTQSFNDTLTQDAVADISISQVGNYADRGNAGSIALNFGGVPKYTPCMSPIHVKLFGDETQWLTAAAQHMHCYLNKQRECQASITEYVAKLIAAKHKLQLNPHFDRNAFEGTYYGTILCDGHGKLNAKSAILELPAGDYSHGEKIPLNLSQLNSYSLFPGQTCVVEGKIIKGVLHATNLYNDGFVSPIQKIETGPIQIIAAAGPFTLKNNLQYEPLQDLLKTVLDVHPHVLILTGPFFDCDHSNINTVTEAYDTFFNTVIDSIMTPLEGTNIQVVVVSSLRDVHHFAVFPTPPYDLPAKYPNLLCVPDPCIIDIDGVFVAITTSDILFNIGKEELSWPPGSVDRMSRLSQYLLHQLSFYPLQSNEAKIPVDYSLLERYGLMETSPHLLIVPSNFRHFVKKLSGCTVVNPERLVKGYAGGTYARLQVQKNLQIACDIVNI